MLNEYNGSGNMKVVLGKLIVFRDRMPLRIEEELAKEFSKLGIETAVGERDSHYLVIDHITHKRWSLPKKKEGIKGESDESVE